MQMRCVLVLVGGMTTLMSTASGKGRGDGARIRGHMEPFGNHRDPILVPEVSAAEMTSARFFEEFVDNNRPVMIRGAALRSPALQRWVNDSDVMAEYGDLRVKLETKKEKDESAAMVGAEGGLGRASLRTWYEKLESEDSYVVSQLPVPMQKDVIIPDVLACHDAVNNVLEANLWMSGGSTRSVIHKDADNALNCLVAGKKRWWFISPKWMNRGLPMADEEEAPGEIGGFSRIDVDAVDLKKYRKLRNVDYQYTEALPGDCLLVPWGYPHQVRSDAGRNVAFTIMFPVDSVELEPRECPESPVFLSNTSVFWDYEGMGEMTMGNSDPELNRKILLETALPTSKPSELTVRTWPSNPRQIRNPQLRQMLTTQRQECLALDLLERESTGVPFIQVYSVYRQNVRPGYGYFGGGYGDRLGWPCDPLADVTHLFEVANLSPRTGRMSVTTAASLPREGVRQALRCLMNTDPANTELYEYFLLEFDEVVEVLEDMIDQAPQGKVGRAQFINGYVKALLGTEYVATQIFSNLDPENTGFITETQLQLYGQKALEKYQLEL